MTQTYYIIEGNRKKDCNNGLFKKIEGLSFSEEEKKKMDLSAEFVTALYDKRKAIEIYSNVADCFQESSLKAQDY